MGRPHVHSHCVSMPIVSAVMVFSFFFPFRFVFYFYFFIRTSVFAFFLFYSYRIVSTSYWPDYRGCSLGRRDPSPTDFPIFFLYIFFFDRKRGTRQHYEISGLNIKTTLISFNQKWQCYSSVFRLYSKWIRKKIKWIFVHTFFLWIGIECKEREVTRNKHPVHIRYV